MEFEIKSFLELNLIVDAVLLLIFSFTVLLRNPKFLLFLVFINLCQYVVWVPDKEILEAHQKLQEQTWENKGHKEGRKNSPELLDGRQMAENLASGDPSKMAGQTAQLYNHVLQGLGAGEGAASASMEISLNAWKKNLSASEKENPEKGIPLNPISILLQAGQGDLHAAWLITRLFWLAATFYLYMQRPQIGATVFAFNLLPIPFLATFVPYLWYRFNQLPWVKGLNMWAESGTVPKETVEFLIFHGIVFAAMTVPLFVVVIAAMSQWRRSKDSGLRGYLDPERFDLLLNGSRIAFQVNDNELLAGDFRLNIRQLSYDPDNPHIWYLKTGTKVEFVEK